MKKGVFCFSLDLELLWGRKENPWPFIPLVQKMRPVVKKLLALLEKYQIPATWAVVGQLFLKGDPLWHAPDLVKMIQKTKNQEIGCHSFSHLIFDEKKCTQEIAQKELQACLKIAQKAGLKLYSFVFPYNQPGHLGLLKKAGFVCFRAPDPQWFHHPPAWKKFFYLLDLLLLFPPPVSEPFLDSSGLVVLPGSMYYLSTRGLRKLIPLKIRVLKAKRGLKRAVKEKRIFHLWCHPLDLAKDTAKMLAGLEEIFSSAVKLRKAGQLETQSMAQITQEFLG